MRVSIENPKNIRIISSKGVWYFDFTDQTGATISMRMNDEHAEYISQAIADQKRIEEIIKSYANA
jgi:hypothetical protein